MLFDTHPLYTQTISQTAVLAQVLAESRARRIEGDGHGLPGRQKHFTTKKEASWSLEQPWCDVRAEKGEWRCGEDSEGQVSLITQHCCYHNTTKPRHTLSLRLKLVHGGVPQTV